MGLAPGERAPKRPRGVEEAQARALLTETFASVRGSLPWYCLDYWSRQLNMDIPALKRELQHMVRVRPYAIEFLTRLHDSHRDVVMVTNAHRKTLDIKMDEVDITHWFDRVVVSHDLDAPKEDLAFWEKLQALLHGALPPSVADRMLQGERVSGDHFGDVSVLYHEVLALAETSIADAREALENGFPQVFVPLDRVLDACAEENVAVEINIADNVDIFHGDPQAIRAMLLNLLLAALVGVGIPLALKATGRDPAMGSSIILTFVTDAGGFFIFLGLATLLLV